MHATYAIPREYCNDLSDSEVPKGWKVFSYKRLHKRYNEADSREDCNTKTCLLLILSVEALTAGAQ